MIKTVIFDVDGTIIDSEVVDLISLNTTMRKYNLPDISKEDYKIAFSMTGEEALQHFNVPEADFMEIRKDWLIELENIRDESEVFPGLLEVIEKLYKTGYELGIITSRNKRELQYDFNRLDLNKYFKIKITADDVKRPKPSIDSLEVYLEKADTRKDEIFFIGDSIHDSEFAKNCQIKFGLAMWGATNLITPATIKLSKPKDILDYINNINSSQ